MNSRSDKTNSNCEEADADWKDAEWLSRLGEAARIQSQPEFRTLLKEKAGNIATWSWIIFGIWHFWRTPSARFLSWQAVVYFAVGMFIAAIVFGWILYLRRLFTVKWVLRSTLSYSMLAQWLVMLACYSAACLEYVGMFLVSRWIVSRMV
jgi:hypothetical protein